jgi:hypothetical protein
MDPTQLRGLLFVNVMLISLAFVMLGVNNRAARIGSVLLIVSYALICCIWGCLSMYRLYASSFLTSVPAMS